MRVDKNTPALAGYCPASKIERIVPEALEECTVSISLRIDSEKAMMLIVKSWRNWQPKG
jgi:hypothetical protein